MANIKKTSSVVMATFNGEKYLEEQLKSLEAQSRVPDQIVISDDGSADKTKEILDGFSQRSNCVVKLLFQEKNLGFVENFSKALAHATGDVIFLCDQDDRWEKNKIERFLQKFESTPSLDAFFCNARMMDEFGVANAEDFFSLNHFTAEEQEFFHRNEGWRVAIKRNVVAGNMLAFRKEWLEKLLPIPSGFVHDAWIVSLLASVGRIDCTHEQLSFYRRHSSQSIGALQGPLLDRIQARWSRVRGTPLSSYAIECGKIDQLLARAQNCGLSRAYEESWLEKKGFLEKRANYASLAIARIPSILANASFYHQFDNGFSSMIKDLAAPSGFEMKNI